LTGIGVKSTDNQKNVRKKRENEAMTRIATQLSRQKNFRFSHRLRVRWGEVAMQKVVFNAHYMMYFNTAIAEYWRKLALPYEEMMRELGGELDLKTTVMEYHAPACFDDRIDVSIRCQEIDNSAIVFKGAIHRGNELLVTCELNYAFVDPINKRAIPVHNALRAVLESYESGAPVLQLKTGQWDELGWDAMEVRIEVFVDEQLIPLELENDADDDAAFHVVVYNGIGQAVATGRLLDGHQGQARIGRMAVKRVLRGSGQGTVVLNALQDEARRRGDHEVALHAQASARDFYAGLGFKARGDIFDEVGLSHIEMFRAL
jgi:YbgC/YbaW family acyl-CoA thioester hydrolase